MYVFLIKEKIFDEKNLTAILNIQTSNTTFVTATLKVQTSITTFRNTTLKVQTSCLVKKKPP